QRGTARRGLVGALHAAEERGQVFRQFRRDGSPAGRVRLAPVERHAKMGAARATAQTGIDTSHGLRRPSFTLRSVKNQSRIRADFGSWWLPVVRVQFYCGPV